jgi:hypothetical protein
MPGVGAAVIAALAPLAAENGFRPAVFQWPAALDALPFVVHPQASAGNPLMSVLTDSPLSGANAEM